MSELNKTVVRRVTEQVYNQGNLDVVDDLVSSDFVAHSASEDIHGPAGMKQFVAALRAAFPDLQMTVEDQVAEGDKVVTRFRARGTHTGTYQGIPPTGKPGEISGTTIDRIADGKAIECWTSADDLGLLQQLGVVPAADQRGAHAPAG